MTEGAAVQPCQCISSNQPEERQTEPALVLTPPWPNHKTVSIDVCIAPQIRALWAARIHTIGSCCGHGEEGPSVIIDSHGVRSRALNAGRRAQRVLQESDGREWKILSWVLTEVGG